MRENKGTLKKPSSFGAGETAKHNANTATTTEAELEICSRVKLSAITKINTEVSDASPAIRIVDLPGIS